MKNVLGMLLCVARCNGISVGKINSELDRMKDDIDTKLFLYETPSFQWIQSTVYRYADFKESLYVMATEGVADKKFYIGEDVTNGHVYGLVNIAAFLAQSMKETIKYDACDENSWDLVNGKYPLSNACGQLGQSYQDYHCSEEEKHMECEVDPNMSITAVTHAKWYGAPAPLFCGPKTQYPHSGFWDYGYECNKGWANPPETCDVYEGQKAGRFDHSQPYANTAGRTDVEGCCWWGRGVIQTSGVCNFGKLNYYLGARAAKEGRESKYPSVDFCKDPEAICSSSQYKELKWVAGMFYWMESVQPYDEGGWNYLDELAKFVEGGMQGTSFIDAVSGIVNRGCHNPPCGTGALDGGHERSANFKKVLDTLFAGSLPEVSGSITSSDSEHPPSPSLFTPSTPSQAIGNKWYPDYNANWAEGKCSNAYPAPSGRPHYDSQSECCAKAYGGQASGVCVGLIEESPSGPTPDLAAVVSITPPPTRKPVSPSSETGLLINSDKFIAMDETLEAVKHGIDTKLFLYETPSFQWIQSTVYRYADFRESLYIMATEGVASKKFYIGEDVTNGHVYGMVNIAAFLAQSMKETIKYDACDENSWDLVNGKYPLSNACGQLGQSYQDYHCSEEEKHMECEVDPNMSITAVTHAKWYGAPAPLFCGPKTQYPHSGFWDYGYECNKGWANPPETCDVYEGQKAGRFDHSQPYANTAGRTDVEGCCWWGRGVIQTSGVCNFGKLNYYLGARAAKEGRESKYPSVDFCKDPEAICSSSQYKELKWVAGMFYWMESVQPYDEGGWNYLDELQKFVEGGMQGTSFIDAVSGIVNRGCHNPPCGTGAVDGGHERSQNFKKVLDTFFEGRLPILSGSITSSNFESQINASSSNNITPSSTPPPSQTSGDVWYPDYNVNWAEGKCSNAYPAPSGRPHYDSQSECCAKAYGNQASGVCVGSIPSSSVESPLFPSSSISDLTSAISITPQPASNPSLAVEGPTNPGPDLSAISVTTQLTNKPVASLIVEEIGDKWYPDYNPIWALGKCSNFSPAPSGRPHYDSQSECCKMAYGGQASGACVGYTTSTVSKTETFYPDYNGDWSLGKCSNAYPAPGGRPQYNSQRECCDKAYAGQSSGACINDLPLTTEENVLDEFYPNYDPLFSKGVCTNKAPLPHGRPIYSSQSECCEFAYRGQASGACVNHIPGDSYKLVSFAETFTSDFMAPHAALRSNFIVYSCGESDTIPHETAIMDILFDYEVSLPQNVQAKHTLPTLKKEIMDSLASSLNCQITQRRRGLRKVADGVLLGFQSLEGSDVLDGEKGSCKETQEVDGERCYPVIGHIAAVLKFEASNDEVIDVKKDILKNIRHMMDGNSISDSSGIKYVNEHDIDNIQQAQVSNIEAEVKADSGSQTWVAVICSLLGIAFGVALTLFVTKGRRIAQMIKSRTHNTDSSDNSICVEGIRAEETCCCHDERRKSRCSSSEGSDFGDQPSTGAGESVNETSHLYQKDECNQTQTELLGRYISKASNDPSIFAGANNSAQPSVESECVRRNAKIALAIENAMMDLMGGAELSDDDDVDEAHDATTEEGDEIDAKHEEKESNTQEGVERTEEVEEIGVSSERDEQDEIEDVKNHSQNFVLVGDTSSVYARSIC